MSYNLQTLRVPTRHGLLDVYEANPAGPSNGETVFVVPGLSASLEGFAALARELTTAGYRVCGYDMLDLIDQPGPHDLDSYTIDAFAEDLLAVVGALTSKPAHLIGHGLSGLVARMAVIEAPERVRSLVLLGSGPSGDTTHYAPLLDLLGDEKPSRGAMALWDRLAPSLVRAGVSAEHLDRLTGRMGRRKPSLLIGLARAFRWEPDRLTELHETGVPTLVVQSADGGAWSTVFQELMAERLGADRVVIDAPGTVPHELRPGETAAILDRFWAGNRLRNRLENRVEPWIPSPRAGANRLLEKPEMI